VAGGDVSVTSGACLAPAVAARWWAAARGPLGPASEPARQQEGRGVVALSRPPSPLLQLLWWCGWWRGRARGPTAACASAAHSPRGGGVRPKGLRTTEHAPTLAVSSAGGPNGRPPCGRGESSVRVRRRCGALAAPPWCGVVPARSTALS